MGMLVVEEESRESPKSYRNIISELWLSIENFMEIHPVDKSVCTKVVDGTTDDTAIHSHTGRNV